MKRLIRIGLAGALLGAFVGLELAGWSISLNPTDSMPVGLYLLGPIGSPGRGDLVSACIPADRTDRTEVYAERRYVQAGPCPSGLARILKPIAAVAGDVVVIDSAGVIINGSRVAGSRLLDRDSQGRELDHLTDQRLVLPAGSYFLLSTHRPNSLDSRYFGPVGVADLVSHAWPLLTF